MGSPKARVLIVEDDAGVASELGAYLEQHSFDVSIAAGADDAARRFHAYDPGVVLLDLRAVANGRIETLQRIKQIKPDVPVILLSSSSNPELIFQASKLGADDYVSKPVEPRELSLRIARILDRQRSAAPTQLREQVRQHDHFATLFGASPRMEEVKMTIEQVADTTATVLIRGESGAGKEVVARMIYSQSARRDKPFVKVNCAAIPHELLESELFGYEPGAFTGAHRQKLGKFDQANLGTIFLDEISELHPALQAKLLHVLQDGEFARLGGRHDIAVDVRVLAATNKLLERAVEEGLFRQDLFYRLNVVTIHIPPLRERREEIPLLLEFFLRKYSEFYGKQPAPFSDYALTRMMEYNWPGNIRELENLVKRYVIVGNEPQIIRELSTHKPIVASASPGFQGWRVKTADSAGVTALPPLSLPAAVASGADLEMPSLLEIGRCAARQAEREAIERVLAQTRWNRRQAAKILKISYKALLNRLKTMEGQKRVQAKQRTA